MSAHGNQYNSHHWKEQCGLWEPYVSLRSISRDLFGIEPNNKRRKIVQSASLTLVIDSLIRWFADFFGVCNWHTILNSAKNPSIFYKNDKFVLL